MPQNVVLIFQVFNGFLVTKLVDFFYCTNVTSGLAPGPVDLTLCSGSNLVEEVIVLRDFFIMFVLDHVLKGKHCIKCNLLISLNRFD